MQRRPRPWWLWGTAILTGLVALAGIVLAIWKLPTCCMGTLPGRAQTPASRRPLAFGRPSLLGWLAWQP
jgi:hypothetical protein